MQKIPWWEITPEDVYINRRKFMIGAGSAASVLALAACAPASMPTPATPTANDVPPPPPLTDLLAALDYNEPFASAATDEDWAIR
ncbi:MAG: hypothetical protein R3A10_10720 [Caldilineaceae bacterium]